MKEGQEGQEGVSRKCNLTLHVLTDENRKGRAWHPFLLLRMHNFLGESRTSD